MCFGTHPASHWFLHVVAVCLAGQHVCLRRVCVGPIALHQEADGGHGHQVGAAGRGLLGSAQCGSEMSYWTAACAAKWIMQGLCIHMLAVAYAVERAPAQQAQRASLLTTSATPPPPPTTQEPGGAARLRGAAGPHRHLAAREHRRQAGLGRLQHVPAALQPGDVPGTCSAVTLPGCTFGAWCCDLRPTSRGWAGSEPFHCMW